MGSSVLTLRLSDSETEQMELVKTSLNQATSNGALRQLIKERIQLQIDLDHDRRLIAEQAETLIQYERIFVDSYNLNNDMMLVVDKIMSKRNPDG